MVRFTDKLYFTDSVKSKIGQIKWKTVCGIGMVNVHLITLALNEHDLFDIYSAANFKQRGLRKSNLCIIGVAGGYSDACELVESMINEALLQNQDVSRIRAYFNAFVNDNISD